MRTLFDNYGITDWDVHKDEPRLDVESLYPKTFDIRTFNPYWYKHPILENYRKYESEQWKKKKEKIMKNAEFERIKKDLENLANTLDIKVFIKELPEKKYIDIEYLFFNPDGNRTLLGYISIDDLKADWFSKLYDTVREHVVKPEFTRVHMDYSSIYASYKTASPKPAIPKITDVRFNGPATIIFWSDDTKSVVKAQNEEFDPEKGIAMAIARKALGNKHNYFDVITKYAKRYRKEKK